MKQNNKKWIYLNLLSLLILITFLTLLFCRAAQKLNIKSHKKKKHHEEKEERSQFPTNFSDVIRMNPPPAPPALVRSSGRLQNPNTGKVSTLFNVNFHSKLFLQLLSLNSELWLLAGALKKLKPFCHKPYTLSCIEAHPPSAVNLIHTFTDKLLFLDEPL